MRKAPDVREWADGALEARTPPQPERSELPAVAERKGRPRHLRRGISPVPQADARGRRAVDARRGRPPALRLPGRRRVLVVPALLRPLGRGARPRDPIQHRGLRAAARVKAASHAGRRPLAAGQAPMRRRSGRPAEEVSPVFLPAWQRSYAVRFLSKYGGARPRWCTGWCTRASGHLPGLHPNCDYPANPKKKRADERTRTAYPCSSYELGKVHSPLFPSAQESA
jgi:hypothetical protein